VTTSPGQDPVLEAEIERALAPYKGLVPPEMLAVMRAELERALTQDAVGQALLKQARPAPVVDQSGDVATRAADGAPAKAEKGGRR